MAQTIRMVGLDFDATLVEHSHTDGVSRVSSQTCAMLASLVTAGVQRTIGVRKFRPLYLRKLSVPRQKIITV